MSVFVIDWYLRFFIAQNGGTFVHCEQKSYTCCFLLLLQLRAYKLFCCVSFLSFLLLVQNCQIRNKQIILSSASINQQTRQLVIGLVCFFFFVFSFSVAFDKICVVIFNWIVWFQHDIWLWKRIEKKKKHWNCVREKKQKNKRITKASVEHFYWQKQVKYKIYLYMKKKKNQTIKPKTRTHTVQFRNEKCEQNEKKKQLKDVMKERRVNKRENISISCKCIFSE